MSTTTPTAGFVGLSDDALRVVRAILPFYKGARLTRYQRPAITVIAHKDCHPGYVAFMRELVPRINLEDRAQVSDEIAFVLRYHQSRGLVRMIEQSTIGVFTAADHDRFRQAMNRLDLALRTLVGDLLFALHSPLERAQWLPWCAYDVFSTRDLRGFQLVCYSWALASGSDGRLLYVPQERQPLSGRRTSLRVAFTPHCVQRVAERVAYGSTWSNFLDIYYLLDYAAWIEPCMLFDNRPALALWVKCEPHFYSYACVEYLLGPQHHEETHEYLVGYCPVIEHGDYLVLKTLLVPGHNGTPEASAVYRASLDPGRKEALLERCRKHSMTTVVTSGDFSLLRWFHHHGVPQVRPVRHAMTENRAYAVDVR